jgi:hypothetical protein
MLPIERGSQTRKRQTQKKQRKQERDEKREETVIVNKDRVPEQLVVDKTLFKRLIRTPK